MIKISALVVFFLMLLSGLSWADPGAVVPAGADSLQNHWGQKIVRADSTTAHFEDQSRPTWEKIALVPYYIIGIPFRIVDVAGRETVKTLDRWGIFDLPPAEHAGLPLPYGVYLLPEGGISGLEGISYGLNIRKPDFLGEDNRAFLTISSSTKHADKLAGGFYFQMNPTWGLQLGAGTADLPLTRYYGLGYGSSAGDRSFYNRISRWVGAELDRDLGLSTSLEMRSYYSQVEARESRYEVDEGLSDIHAGNLPYGFPGESNGWSFKLGLVRDATVENGRPQGRGFQKASISWFQGTDDPDLSFIQYAFDLQHFFPLWFTGRTLGLRAFGVRLHNNGTSEIPLTRMVTMYHPNSLRGFSDLRFYGLGNVGLSAEYRWPLWVAKGRKGLGMDAYIFTDMGQVFDRSSEIAINHLSQTAGFGVRFIGSEGQFLGRFELGFSNEETVVTLTFSQTFQHHGKGLLHGKDPSRRP